MARNQSQPTRTRRLRGQRGEVVLAPCEVCNGVECGTPRIAVCCENCTH
jgi:hypothetical protein